MESKAANTENRTAMREWTGASAASALFREACSRVGSEVKRLTAPLLLHYSSGLFATRGSIS